MTVGQSRRKVHAAFVRHALNECKAFLVMP
jgi:hypothetical protein